MHEDKEGEKRKFSGYDFERLIFGIDSSQMLEPHRLGYDDSLLDAIRRHRKLQWNPKTPSTPMAKELHNCVRSYLPADMQDSLRLYCALGSSLDFWHGVDGFFMTDEKGVATFDVSCRNKPNVKADFLIKRRDISIYMWRTAQKIAYKLMGRQVPE